MTTTSFQKAIGLPSSWTEGYTDAQMKQLLKHIGLEVTSYYAATKNDIKAVLSSITPKTGFSYIYPLSFEYIPRCGHIVNLRVWNSADRGLLYRVVDHQASFDSGNRFYDIPDNAKHFTLFEIFKDGREVTMDDIPLKLPNNLKKI